MAGLGLVGRVGAALSGAVSGAVSGVLDGFSTEGGARSPYNAASRRQRLRGWIPTRQGPNSTVQLSAGELVARSRDARRNDPTAKRISDLLVTHVVGTGIKPSSQCPNKALRAQLTQLFGDWVPFADADGQLDFYGLQALAVGEMVGGGEAFCRLRTRRLSDGYPVPLQVQVLPTEMLPMSWNVPTGNAGTTLLQGIERNGIGQRIAYWFYPEHPTDVRAVGDVTDYQPSRVPSADVCHLYRVDEAGQMRGLPWLSTALTTLHHLDAYLDAELERKKAAALLMTFIETPAGEAPPTAVDLARLGPVTMGGGPGAGPDGLPAGLDGLPSVELEPGTGVYLQPGEKVTFSAPVDVGSTFDIFIATNHRRAAAAANVLYEELTGDWRNMNDRTYRAAFNTFKRSIMAVQYGLVCQQFCIPVWNRFVDYAVAAGTITVPAGMADADLKRVSWAPQRWDYINPAQDIAATGDELALGITSRTDVILARGDDPAQVNAQIIADKAEEKASGLNFGLASIRPQPEKANEGTVGPEPPTMPPAPIPPTAGG